MIEQYIFLHSQGSKYMYTVAILANTTKKLTFATNKTHCESYILY
jgi:hypothetical protein